MATETVESLPPPLNATAEQPPLFDGTTRLYTSYACPFAQRVWITRNYKGLQDKIKLVPLDLANRPAWYKENVYPENKVPSLEHNGKVIGESLDLIKYVDSNFEGPSLSPYDPDKKKFLEELLSYVDKFVGTVFTSFKGDPTKEAGAAFDYLEDALKRYDGPFFLGLDFSLLSCLSDYAVLLFLMLRFIVHCCFLVVQNLSANIYSLVTIIIYVPRTMERVSVLPMKNHFFIPYLNTGVGVGHKYGVDIAYIPFVERFQIFFSEVFKYDITSGRPKLVAWIEEVNKIDAYKQTKKVDPKQLVEYYKQRFLAQN